MPEARSHAVGRRESRGQRPADRARGVDATRAVRRAVPRCAGRAPRLRRLCGPAADRMYAGTFHAMCARLLFLAAPLVIGASIPAATAHAGTFQVPACIGSTPAINDAWQPFNSSATYLETSSNCGASPITGGSAATSGLAASDVLPLSTNVPAGALVSKAVERRLVRRSPRG